MENNSFLYQKVSTVAGLLIITVSAFVILGGAFWYASYLTISSYFYNV